MTQSLLLIPLLLTGAAAIVATVYHRTGLRDRLSITALTLILAVAPLGAFVLLFLQVPALSDGEILQWAWAWMPSYDLSITFYVDSLSALFALLVTLIGTLVIIYAGQYFKGDNTAGRFVAYMFLFMTSMLGLVMAGDVITLFIFWEGTSITSFLLVAYKAKYAEARKGAFRALFITGGGGIVMLAGLLFVASAAGGTDWQTILASGDLIRSDEFYLAMLLLVAFGAFTKSAQWPAHIWLPGAMSAPTPASAYLHSATMVKAGIYLLARMHPALGSTEAWYWLLTGFGLITMLTGAYLGLKQNDLKALLAYSTISQLGVLVMLIGQDIPEAFKALVIGIIAHALYKSSLFLIAGIIDHETGTRDIRRLGGLRKVMPFTFVIGTIGALSMAGLPPLFGFLAKETLLAAAVHPTLPPLVATLLPWASVAAGALLLAQSGLLVYETFLGQPKDESIHAHEAPRLMWLMPAIPALMSLVVSVLPEAQQEAEFLASAAGNAFGGEVKVSLALWTGLNIPLLLSVVAITLGSILFVFRHRVRAWQDRLSPGWSFNQVYDGALALIDKSAWLATRLQMGRLRLYLMVMLSSVVLLVIIFGRNATLPAATAFSMPTLSFTGEVILLRAFSLLLVVVAALATVVLKRDFYAILAVTASGLAMALLFLLEPAPDVALVQVVVDILSLVILVLALARLPRLQRRRAQDITDSTRGSRRATLPDAIVSGAIGLVVALMAFVALTSRPRESIVTPFFQENAKPLVAAADVVGAIIVDFRALDTLIEIAVFAMAGLGVFTLLTFAARKHGDHSAETEQPPRRIFNTRGIGGQNISPFIRVPAAVTLPLSIVLAITHMMYGHDQPGDGFTAGVIIGLAISLWYVVFGYEDTRRRIRWLRPSRMIAFGILLAIATAMITAFINGAFFSNVDFGAMINLPLPNGFYISSSFLFEVAICLTVLGSVVHMLNALGHPGEEEPSFTEPSH